MVFLESHMDQNRGRLEVITGCMFSGKTEELIRRLKRAMLANLQLMIFKPSVDMRDSGERIRSHDSREIPSTRVDLAADILPFSKGMQVVGMDEAQFFDAGIVEVCNTLANQGIRVILAGLDLDYRGQPFGPMPDLLAVADQVTKVHAICLHCGSLAHYSYRKKGDGKQIMLGAKEEYEPLCRQCFTGRRQQKGGGHETI